MLSENETVISFVPGSVTINNKTKKVTSKTLGQIVVHDRIKVESDILPRYFNHSSFASLRRQLNYFSFTRIGKGRQKGAVYCNEGVIEIDDILRLRRRPAQTTTGTTGSPLSTSTMLLEDDGVALPAVDVTGTVTPSSSVTSSSSSTTKKRRSSLLSDQENRHQPVSKKSRVTSTTGSSTSLKLSSSRTLTATTTTTPKVVSPRTSPLHSSTVSPTSSVDGGEFRIILDLTIPPPQQPELNDTGSDDDHYYSCNNQNHHNHDDDVMVEDEDVLAGCQALLSFAQGRPSVTA
jgi:hypothetical protein